MKKIRLHILWRIDESSYANRLILDSKQFDHFVVCLKNNVNNPHFIEVLKSLKIIWFLEFILWKLSARKDKGLFTGSSLFGKYPWKRIRAFIERFDDCDIIVHWVGYNMLDIQKVDLDQEVKIILHDFHLISGGCHIVEDCSNFSNCNYCPKSNRKTSERRRKIQFLASLGKIKFFAPSEYVQKRIEPIESELVYAPTRIENLSDYYSPIKDIFKLVIIGASSEIATKGYERIKRILSKFNSITKSEIIIYSVGSKLNLHNEINHSRLNSMSIFRLIAECDLLLQPSEYETFSQVTLEAAFQNTPVIAWDNSGPCSIVTNGKNGFLIPAFDEDKFLLAIQENLLFKRENLPSIKAHNDTLKLKINSRNRSILES